MRQFVIAEKSDAFEVDNHQYRAMMFHGATHSEPALLDMANRMGRPTETDGNPVMSEGETPITTVTGAVKRVSKGGWVVLEML